MAAMDKARAHRAVQELRGERDKLLTSGNKRMGAMTSIPDDGKDRARALLWSGALLAGPAVAYASVILAWFFAFHDYLVRFLVLLVSLVSASVCMAILSFKWAGGKERPWLWWLGFFSGQATCVALVVGFFLYYRNLVYYLKYEEMRTYTNVAAAQDDAGFPDANMFLFTQDTRLSMERAVGYKSKWDGNVYCVAPVMDQTMSVVSPVYYWAIGENCCDTRADFHCGGSGDYSTRSALVALRPSDIVRPFMKWAVRGSAFDKYLSAVELQSATYMMKAAPDPTFIYWTRDPIALKDSFYSAAVNLCVKASLMYLALLLAQIYLAAWSLLRKQKPHGVLRYAE
eukprot:TRINITY_DN5776_c0_g1_i2.p1 TRINITY_DN5776_c0_g1~~TRINITY_DN5776_c0_g1_i2.p1  ORF type:complete len:342 (-),score=60.27 TRINITY_DN5776_c0_g1_i2:66-1091(-)